MRDFYKLEDWDKDRDFNRRNFTKKFLKDSNIKFSCPCLGHFKIESNKTHTLMFYPKSGTIIWKDHKRDFQHKFINEDPGKLLRKLIELI